MTQLFASASKLVLLFFALCACVGFLMRLLDVKDFMILASMVFGFYFGKSMPGATDVAPANPPLVERRSTVIESSVPAPTDPAA